MSKVIQIQVYILISLQIKYVAVEEIQENLNYLLTYDG